MRLNRLPDLTGKMINRWKVIRRVPSVYTSYLCECTCPNHTRRIVNALSLYHGKSKSCGCYMIERASERTYTDKEILLHRRLDAMKTRCYNKNSSAYRNYGARGITICDEWMHNRESFVKWSLDNGFDVDLTIDRIDVNGPYAPWNCRWVDMSTQANNRRTSHYIVLDGEKKTLEEWKSKLGRYGNAFGAWTYSHSEKEVVDRLRYLLDAIEKNPNYGPEHRETNSPVQFMGETHSIQEWADRFGVAREKIYNLARRMSYEDAIKITYEESKGIRHVPHITLGKHALTIPEWAKILHVNKHMLSNKLRAIRDKSEYIDRLMHKKISIFDRPPKDIAGATGESSKLPR